MTLHSLRRGRVLALGLWQLVVSVATLLLFVLVLTTLLQVLSRYVFRRPFDWTEEAARYVFVWLGMMGAGIAARERAHFFVDILVERLPAALGRYVVVAVGVLSSAFLLVISWAALDLALSNAVQDSPVLTVPMSVPYFAIPVGFTMMAVFTIADTVRNLRGGGRHDTTER
jgi:TRAP-type C4-dicarboxylate transport system permease small subunit